MKLTAIFIFVLLVGCGTVGPMLDRATTERPDTGKVPAAELARDLPVVAANPADVSSWRSILEAAAYILGGGAITGGALKVLGKKNAGKGS